MAKLVMMNVVFSDIEDGEFFNKIIGVYDKYDVNIKAKIVKYLSKDYIKNIKVRSSGICEYFAISKEDIDKINGTYMHDAFEKTGNTELLVVSNNNGISVVISFIEMDERGLEEYYYADRIGYWTGGNKSNV